MTKAQETHKNSADVIRDTIAGICAPDEAAMEESRRHWDGIAKPLGSLGKLEQALVQIAGIQRTPVVHIDKKALVIMCADNGVVCEGISQTGQEVTAIVAENFLDEKSCAAIMCKNSGTDIFPIDIGMAEDTPRVEKRKIAYGTANMAEGPAMTRRQAEDAVAVGIQKVCELKEAGYQILATGEMGIGNTTTSSAMAAVLLDLPVETVTGRGAGLSTEGVQHKIAVIRSAIRKNQPDAADPMDVLAKVGGFDIAGLTGVFLGGAAFGIPAVIDGFISAVAALTAVRIAPACADYILASHVSKEPAAKLLLEELGKSAFLTCDMCLGEGTGAVALFPLLDFASDIYHKMSTFADIRVEAYEHLE